MNSDVVESLWQLLHSDGFLIPQFANKITLADETTCFQVVNLLTKVFKAERELPSAKLCALQVPCM